MNQVFLFTDGSCKRNPGLGGYAAILQIGAHEKTLTGSEAHAANNRMELQADIVGLAALKRRCQVTLVTDSQYVATILNGGKARANRNLVQQVRALAAGHRGHAMNERYDVLAQEAAL